jgi:ABC-type lipoprotein export system ATPase subunit|tara:strand:+ start:509 stop:1177 length:669 start_codon:yes stop_codon:yes gene_type:complete
MNKILELKKISRTYFLDNRPVDIFKDINLTIKSREKIALVGPSGCGKTSLLHIAGLLEAPSSGEVFVRDEKINWSSDNSLSNYRLNDIGFIFQFNNLLEDFNALENIALPNIIAGNNKKNAFEKSELLLSQVGLQDRMKSFPNQLSGGEQQRVAIARSLINNPSIILADEPTGNLDFKSSMNVIELFNKLIDEYNCSIILATHDLNVADLQDKVISIEELGG